MQRIFWGEPGSALPLKCLRSFLEYMYVVGNKVKEWVNEVTALAEFANS